MSTTAGIGPVPPEAKGFRRLWRVVRQIFHEVIGASFALLAFGWLNSAIRAWTRDLAPWLVGVSIVVGLLFVVFSVSSFRRARQL
jgi:hypothetical protein